MIVQKATWNNRPIHFLIQIPHCTKLEMYAFRDIFSLAQRLTLRHYSVILLILFSAPRGSGVTTATRGTVTGVTWPANWRSSSTAQVALNRNILREMTASSTKYHTSIRWLSNVGIPSSTVGQHYSTIGSVLRICRVRDKPCIRETRDVDPMLGWC